MSQIWIYNIPVPATESSENFTDLFNWMDIEGLEETPDMLKVYIKKDDCYEFEEHLANITAAFQIAYTKELLEEKNWNEDWERSFQPVKIGKIAGVRASFHAAFEDVPYDIIINPKMSFGTGHHATTRQVMELMSLLPVKNSKVLDVGSGTGILAILAAKMGAKEIIAVDNDHWCTDNHLENNELNNVFTDVRLGNLGDIEETNFDLILANIQRNYLMEHMESLECRLKPGGSLIISGFLPEDNKVLLDKALECHLLAIYQTEAENWSCILLRKPI